MAGDVMSRFRRALGVGAAMLFSLLACPAWADEPIQVANPLIEAAGRKPEIASVTVTFPDGAYAAGLDRAAARYVEQKLPAERRQRLDAISQTRTVAPDTTAERFAEYLAEDNLRARLVTTAPMVRPFDLSIAVETAHFPGLVGLAVNPLSKFPYVEMRFALADAQTKAPFARGRIERCSSWAADIEDAKTRHDLKFNWSGTDSDFRMMTGMTSALADCVVRLVQADTFPVGRERIGTAFTGAPFFISFPISISEPVFQIEIVPPVAAPPPQ